MRTYEENNGWVLNLIHKEEGSVDYSFSRFPDGEIQITLDKNFKPSVWEDVYVVACIKSPEDLFILQQVDDVLSRFTLNIKIVLTYLMGMRMDRKMAENRPFSFKLISNILDTLTSTHIEVLEPHSKANFETCDKLIYREATDKVILGDDLYYIFPDKGANERYKRKNSTCCEKVRDLTTGQILGLKIVDEEYVKNHNEFWVLDDLCDGGRTFEELAKKVREINPQAKLNISITHAVNLVGIKRLLSKYNKVYISNSYKDWDLDDGLREWYLNKEDIGELTIYNETDTHILWNGLRETFKPYETETREIL